MENAKTVAAPSPSNSYALSENELKVTMARAQHGNIAAMNRLANYYLIYNDELGKGFYWLERAGDAGDLKAREFLLGHYAEQKSQENVKYGQTLRARWENQK